MSDTKLRDLERAAAGGDEEAGARYLQERMRQDLSEDQVELLAYCLHPPAYRALGWEPIEGFDHVVPVAVFRRPDQEVLYRVSLSMPGWSQGLRRWGRTPAALAGLAAARLRYLSWRQEWMKLEAQGADLPYHMSDVSLLLDAIGRAIDGGDLDGRHDLAHEGRKLVTPAVRQFFNAFESAGGAPAMDLVPAFAGDLAEFFRSFAYRKLSDSMSACGDFEEVLAVVRSQLVPWVLGWERQKGRP